MLYGPKNNGGKNWYINHLDALNKAAIMTNVAKPEALELKGYILIMMMRAENGKKLPSIKSGNVQNPPRSGNNQLPPSVKSGNNQI